MALALAALVGAGCGVADVGQSPCRGEVSDAAQPPVHHDPDLEARFPDTVAGHPLELQSFCANATDLDGATLDPGLLDRLDVELDDITFATNTPSIGDPLSVSVSGWRYRGASEDDLRSELVGSMGDMGEHLQTLQRAGKQVEESDGPVMVGTVFYFAGDTLYLLSGVESEVDEVLGALP